MDRESTGVGLGLMICHSLIKQNNGELTFFSEGLNKGSTFMFTMEMEEVKMDLRMRQIGDTIMPNRSQVGISKKKKKRSLHRSRDNSLPSLTQVE